MRDLLKGYFRAEDDIEEIQRTLSSDPVLSRGMRHLEGLRIVKMDEWECLVSYMLATYANIPRITKMVEALCRRYGSDIGNGFMAFPSLERLRKASIADLRALRLGYRADYIRSACDSLSGEHLEQLKKMPYPDLRERLIELPGVGEKVADCVSLFGFGRLEAFPIDVWMERALARLYGQKGSYARLMSFAHARFGKYAGYAQEYLYHNERMHAHADACVFTKA